MGFSEKHQVEGGGLEVEGKKWVIAGVPIRAPLKEIRTKKMEKDAAESDEEGTPTAKEARIPEKLPCPPAPRKRRPSSRCSFSGAREFFNPPDLESVFVRRVQT